MRAGEKARAFKSDAATLRAAIETAVARVRAADERKARDEAALIKKTWPGARPSPKGALFVVRRKGSGYPAGPAPLRVRYTARQLDGRQMASSADEGRPVPGTAAETFDYVVGKTRITPALDEALLEMRPGERRTVIAQGGAGLRAGRLLLAREAR